MLFPAHPIYELVKIIGPYFNDVVVGRRYEVLVNVELTVYCVEFVDLQKTKFPGRGLELVEASEEILSCHTKMGRNQLSKFWECQVQDHVVKTPNVIVFVRRERGDYFVRKTHILLYHRKHCEYVS